MPQAKWIGLGYFIPATPSKGRVYVWRRLKSIGAQVIRPGMAALPNTPQNVEKFTLLVAKIEELSGEALLIEFNFLTQHQTQELQQKFEDASRAQYREMLDKCAGILEQLDSAGEGQRALLEQQLVKLIGKYHQSPVLGMMPQAAADLERGLSELVGTLKSMPNELKALLKR